MKPHPTSDETLTQQIRVTHPGMAHWANSGPLGATCGDCVFLGYWRQYRNSSGDVIDTRKQQGCAKYRQLTGIHGPAVPPSTAACRHFERAEG